MIKIDGLFIPYVDAEKLTVTEIGAELQKECCHQAVVIEFSCASINCQNCFYDDFYNDTSQFIKFAKDNWC